MKREIQIELTLRCIFNCIHCSGSARQDYVDVELPKIQQRLEKLKALDGEIAEIVLTGGEPLLRPDLGEIIRLSRGIADNITLFTTGCNSKGIPEREEWAGYKDAGLRTAVFSVHSIDRSVNDSYFRAPALDYTLMSIKNADAAGINVQVNCALTAKNIGSLNSTMQALVSGYGIQKLRLLRFVSQGRGAEENNQLYVNATACENLINDLKEKYGDLVHPEGFPSLHRCRSNEEVGAGCQFGTGFFYIDTRGDVLPCPAVKRNIRTRIGNIDDSQDVKGLFYSGSKIAEGIDANNDGFRCLSQASWKENS